MNLKRGFLPENDPLQQLPSPFDLWDAYGKELPKLLLSNSLRTILEQMPILTIEKLQDDHLERAMLLLSFFGHAYVWGKAPPAKRLSASIAIPWYAVATRLGRPPVLSYASYALNNWRRIENDKPVALGNITLLQNFLGGLDEEWFVLVHIDIEMKAAHALNCLRPLSLALEENDEENTFFYLKKIVTSLEEMCQTLDRMPENCDPYIYFNRVRPYIHAWKENPALPEGLIYEGVDEFAGKPQRFRGETGAQSSIIPSFDTFFGIQHYPDPLHIYLMEMRDYMPSDHRAFIKAIEQKGSIREKIIQASSDIKSLYNQAICLIVRFRQTHIRYAAHYIQKQSQHSLANPTNIGTGGTPFMKYLRKHKDETLKFLIK
jgi:indoleamine 2,3-dioxygenase